MSRNVWIAAVAVALLAIVIVVGLQSRQGDVGVPSPSPTISARPSASATATATPAGTSSPAATQGSAVYNDDFGFIVIDGGGPSASFRKESSDVRLASFEQQGFAVSPDGRLTAFWKPGPQMELRVTGGAAEQTLVTLPAGQRGGGVAWSSDGAGFLYSTETGSFGVGGGTNSATLDVYEFVAGGRRGTIDTQSNTGFLYRPIAWDRSTNLAAAGLTGEGGAMAFYVTVLQQPDRAFDAQRVDTKGIGFPMGSVRASTDGKLVLGVTASGDVRWWPIGEISASKTLAVPGSGKRGAQWRPGTHQIGFIGPDGHAQNDPFWLGDVDKSAPANVCCVAFGGVPPTARIETFRADGTAVLLVVAPARAGAAATSDYTLVGLPKDPPGGLEYPTSGGRSTFQVIARIAASVRLH